MLFVILKHNIRTCDVNFAGGTHGLTAMAAALAAAGHRVHLLYCSNKAAVFQKALVHGFMSSISYSQHTEGVIQWTEASGVASHVSLTDVEASYAGSLASSLGGIGLDNSNAQLPVTAQRLYDEACSVLPCANSAESYVILDNDGCSGALFQALASRFQRRLLLFIQNIHFLPFGPQGTAARVPGVVRSWTTLGGILCVSQFVAAYIRTHTQNLGLNPSRVHAVGYNAWGPFGSPESAQDFSSMHSQQISNIAAAAAPSCSSGTAAAGGAQRRPVIGMLKLTPEKGAALFLALAAQLPLYKFVAVTADQVLLQQQQQQRRHESQLNQNQQQQPQHHQQQQLFLPSNVTLIEPASDLDQLLQHVHLVLAPSFWQEAFGMAVVDAMLRGIPVITSNQGGLPEAGLGVALQLPVVPLQLPVTPASATAAGVSGGSSHSGDLASDIGGYPRWEDRQVVLAEGQPVGLWVEAIQRLLGNDEQYKRAAKAARAAAVSYVSAQPQELQNFLHWLAELQGLGL